MLSARHFFRKLEASDANRYEALRPIVPDKHHRRACDFETNYWFNKPKGPTTSRGAARPCECPLSEAKRALAGRYGISATNVSEQLVASCFDDWRSGQALALARVASHPSSLRGRES
jgi:hypothetical protein